jgi:hypothetical protein
VVSAPPETVPTPHRLSNRFIGGIIVGIMAIVALLSVVFVWDPDLIRRGDFFVPKTRAFSIPWILRFALGIYVFALVYAVVRGWSMRPPQGTPTGQERRPASWSFTAVAIAAAVGLILLVMVIQTRPDRRTEDEKPPKQQKLVRQVAPSDLDILGYLPEKTPLVLGVHIAELMQAGGDFRQQILSLARQVGLEELEQQTGLKLADCDQVVAGLNADRKPLLICVLQTRQPYEPARLARTAGTRNLAEFRDKPVYRFRLKGSPATLIWCVEPRVLVVVSRPAGATIEDLQELPPAPRKGGKKLPAPLRTLFKDRPLGVGTSVWLAGHFPNTEKVEHWLARVPALKDYDGILEQIQTFGLGIRLEQQVILNAELQGRDDASARTLAGLLRTFEKPVRELVSKEIGWRVTSNPRDNWVDLQVKAKPEMVFNVLSKGKHGR